LVEEECDPRKHAPNLSLFIPDRLKYPRGGTLPPALD
jgi:hypothetical protein